MKRILFLSLIVALLSSCGSSGNGELTGDTTRKQWNPTDPYGMRFIPQGSFIMGPSDQDVPFANVSTNQRVSVGAFYMDETEITNNEYRQFENWVVDSIIRYELGLFQTDGPRDKKYVVTSKRKERLTFDPKNPEADDLAGLPRIDWKVDYTLDHFTDKKFEFSDINGTPLSHETELQLITTHNTYFTEGKWTSDKIREKIYDDIFIRDYIDGKPVKTAEKFTYVYEEINIRALSKQNKDFEKIINKKLKKLLAEEIIIKEAGTTNEKKVISDKIRDLEAQLVDGDWLDINDHVNIKRIPIYPSTLDYQSDYVYSNNETDAEYNYEHVAHDDYPVVGITWEQANAFCHWRTHIMNQYLKARGEPILPDFRLPTETEWEYAARGGLGLSPYPWGGPYTRNMKGCFLANFHPLKGQQIADGGLKAIKVRQYNPNNYGLYDMAGNVAEWTSTLFTSTSPSFTNSFNPSNLTFTNASSKNVEKRKVIRGGSWKDIAYFIQTSTRDYEYDDVSTSYIGFRCVMDFLGRDKKDFKNNN